MSFRDVYIHIVIISTMFGFCTSAVAQNHVADSLVSKGDSLRMVYDFEKSIAMYNDALKEINDTVLSVEDSLLNIGINDRILLSENGKAMSGFVYSPKVVARHTFSVEDFFLYYPLRDSVWRQTPSQLDTLSGPLAKAIYAPGDATTIYFSAQDKDGIRNIYSTSLMDSLWTLPALLNEDLTSASNEVYPVVSQDGKRLYFASQGLFGVGGYDLYVSQWDESVGDWSAPTNMGFPYSSPAHDYLLVESEDGKHMVFASDRNCPKDSLVVYVLEKESVPVRSAVTDPAQLMGLSMLEPSNAIEVVRGGKDVKSEIPENVDTRRYMDKMSHVRALRDSISKRESDLAHLREEYSLADTDAEKKSLAGRILESENLIPELQGRLDLAVRQLQDIEMDFLFSGVVIDPDKLLVEAEREVVGETTGYVFSKMNFGKPLDMKIEDPEPEFDYSFKVLEQAQVLKDSVSGKGIVYQIQIMSTERPAPLKTLKGLSPVFESVSSGGRYVYRVGLFHQYKDVLPHLNTVKRLGFRSAYIVASVDGVEKKVAVARNLEATLKAKKPEHYKVVITFNGEIDPVALTGLRQQIGDRDMARMGTTLIVSPYESKDEAASLMMFVESMGYGTAKFELLNNE